MFLLHDAVLARYMLTSCLSSRLSITSQSSAKAIKPRVTKTTPCGSPGTIVFDAKDLGLIPIELPPNGGAKYRWGRLNSATVYPIFHYISETIQDRYIVTTEG